LKRNLVFHQQLIVLNTYPPPPSPPSQSIFPSFFNRILPDDGLTATQREFKSRERKVIFDQLQRGKLSDALKAGAGRDKLFIAPATLAESSNVFFPDTPLTSVAAQLEVSSGVTPSSIFNQSKVTVVTIAFQALGQQMLQPWHAALFNESSRLGIMPTQWLAASKTLQSSPTISTVNEKEKRDIGSIQFLNIVYLQGWFFKLFQSVMLSSVKGALDPRTASSSAVAFEPSLQKMDHFCEKLSIHNRMMGYVFIVDKEGRVQWSAHGPPVATELENFGEALTRSVKR
jgi:hypothetical protein